MSSGGPTNIGGQRNYVEPPTWSWQLATRASEEFDNLSDFIWKAPRLVETERELELAKLHLYFPNDPVSRDLRWRDESHNLDHVFPYLIAVGNLFALLSLFESYVLALCSELEPRTPVELSSVNGMGISRLFKFLRRAGAKAEDLPLHQQIQAAISIRNCLIHASGVLSWSRDNNGLRDLQRTINYLSSEHQAVRTAQGGEYVYLQPSPLGDRLMIRSDYCHLLCFYLKSYFVSLCENAQLMTATTLQRQTARPFQIRRRKRRRAARVGPTRARMTAAPEGEGEDGPAHDCHWPRVLGSGRRMRPRRNGQVAQRRRNISFGDL